MNPERNDLIVMVAGIVATGVLTIAAEKLGVADAHEIGMTIITGLFALAKAPNRAAAAEAGTTDSAVLPPAPAQGN